MAWAHKTTLTSLVFIEVPVPSQLEKWAVMHIHVKGIDFAFVSMICQFEFFWQCGIFCCYFYLDQVYNQCYACLFIAYWFGSFVDRKRRLLLLVLCPICKLNKQALQEITFDHCIYIWKISSYTRMKFMW